MLLFLIGLELEPSRLWVLRHSVFGLGGSQVLLTGLIFMGAGLLTGFSLPISFLVGFGLAMSSTAFVLQLLSDKNQLTSQHGRKGFCHLALSGSCRDTTARCYSSTVRTEHRYWLDEPW
jgi:glutathione-regulated potassium-efflux system protein KefB